MVRYAPFMGKAFFYSDGLNLLHAIGKKHRWLNLVLLARLILEVSDEELEVNVVHFFVSQFLHEDRASQATYLAVQRLFRPLVKTHLGWFQKKRFFCRQCRQRRNNYCKECDLETIAREEKSTDVGIGCQMVIDALSTSTGTFFLMSRDGDFIPAIRAVREAGKKIFVVSPSVFYNRKLHQEADGTILLEPVIYQQCQLPDEIDAGDRIITRPEDWS